MARYLGVVFAVLIGVLTTTVLGLKFKKQEGYAYKPVIRSPVELDIQLTINDKTKVETALFLNEFVYVCEGVTNVRYQCLYSVDAVTNVRYQCLYSVDAVANVRYQCLYSVDAASKRKEGISNNTRWQHCINNTKTTKHLTQNHRADSHRKRRKRDREHQLTP
ncbi:hypothetical protein FSP39_009692 [Pinctada imbricata]|uniref:Uncharacterized protein n=1 Tax=Pinctada imbricata TaxID=66713 RepID=A0AA88YQ71_PINIB|nr:hypothetical protein FSP39_009692 [Pinctada imbricata]